MGKKGKRKKCPKKLPRNGRCNHKSSLRCNYHPIRCCGRGKKIYTLSAICRRGRWLRMMKMIHCRCRTIGSVCKRVQAKQRRICRRRRYGCFIVQCNRDGSFKPMQCHGSTGYCWCVDTKGTRKSRPVNMRGRRRNLRCGGKKGPKIPKRCTTWFDGCNVCRAKNGKKLGCTRKHCRRKKRAKCVRYQKVTPCKTTKNVPCVFPFTYKGKKYYKCTTKNYGKKLWCATTAVYKRGKWGRCKPGCKVTGSVCKRVQAKQRRKCGRRRGCFIVQCNRDGSFKPMQCHGS